MWVHTSARSARPAQLPMPASMLVAATFAVANCQNYANGQYAAHRDLAEHKPDFVVFLGDYIYEDAGIPGSEDPTAACASRSRTNHARGLPKSVRPVQVRSAPPGRARGLPVVRHLGRPRGREQLRRPDAAGSRRRADIPRLAASRRTRRGGSTSRSGSTRRLPPTRSIASTAMCSGVT